MNPHPLPDDLILAFLCDRLEGAPRQDVETHLQQCPACARRARSLSSWSDALAWAFPGSEDARPSETTTARVRAALEPSPSPRSWWPAAAAALLLVVAGAGWQSHRRQSPHPLPPPSAPRGPSRLVAAEGLEILLGPGATLASREASLPVLTRGACLVLASGKETRLAAGGLQVVLRDAEALVRMLPPSSPSLSGLCLGEARADEGEPAEVLLFSGTAEVLCQGRRLALHAGEGMREGQGAPHPVRADQLAVLRESVLAPGEAPPAWTGGSLDGRGSLASWLADPGASCYSLQVRLRVPEQPALMGLSFVVDGRDTLWVPEAKDLADGAWHRLCANVSPGWVTLLLDGRLCYRVPRGQFKPNPVAGASGAGVAVWGGSLEVSELRLEPWP